MYAPDAFNYQWTHAGGLVNNDGGDWLPGIYAVCWYFGQSLTDIMAAAGEVVPLGIIGSAQGGTMIEMWAPLAAQQVCSDIQCLCTTPHCNGSAPLSSGNCTNNGLLVSVPGAVAIVARARSARAARTLSPVLPNRSGPQRSSTRSWRRT